MRVAHVARTVTRMTPTPTARVVLAAIYLDGTRAMRQAIRDWERGKKGAKKPRFTVGEVDHLEGIYRRELLGFYEGDEVDRVIDSGHTPCPRATYEDLLYLVPDGGARPAVIPLDGTADQVHRREHAPLLASVYTPAELAMKETQSRPPETSGSKSRRSDELVPRLACARCGFGIGESGSAELAASYAVLNAELDVLYEPTYGADAMSRALSGVDVPVLVDAVPGELDEDEFWTLF